MSLRYKAMIFLSSLGFGVIAPVLSLLLAAHGCSLSQIGLAFGAFAVVVIAAEIPSGVFADLYGRKASFLISCALSALSCAMLLLAHTFLIAMAGLMLFGLSAAFASGSIEALIVDETLGKHGKEALEKTVSSIAVYQCAGMAVGALAGGYLPNDGLYTAHLFTRMGLALTTAMLAGAFLHEGAREHKQREGLLKLHLKQMFGLLKQKRSLTALLFALFVIAALLPLFFNKGIRIQPKEAHERAKKADVIYFFARRSIWKQIGFLFLYYSGLIGTLAMLKPWLVDLGYDMKEIGVMSGVAGTFVGFLSSFAGGMIVRRIGRFRARILFAVFVLMATLYFLGLSYVHPTTPMLYGGIFLLWGSYGMATIVVYTTAMDCVRPGREGTDFTIQTVITHLSGMLMAILSGKIADHTGYHGLFFFEASIALISLIYIITVFRKETNTI